MLQLRRLVYFAMAIVVPPCTGIAAAQVHPCPNGEIPARGIGTLGAPPGAAFDPQGVRVVRDAIGRLWVWPIAGGEGLWVFDSLRVPLSVFTSSSVGIPIVPYDVAPNRFGGVAISDGARRQLVFVDSSLRQWRRVTVAWRIGNMAALPDASIIGNAAIATKNLYGIPLHRIRGDGEITESFGSVAVPYSGPESPIGSYLLARDDAGDVWTVNAAGGPVSHLTESRQSASQSPSLPWLGTPYLAAIAVDREYVWLLSRRDSPLRSEKRKAAARLVVLINRQGGQVFRCRLREPADGFAAPRIAYRLRAGSDNTMAVELIELATDSSFRRSP